MLRPESLTGLVMAFGVLVVLPFTFGAALFGVLSPFFRLVMQLVFVMDNLDELCFFFEFVVLFRGPFS
jgi:hypothetical protein